MHIWSLLTDFIFMVDHSSHMFVTGPDVIKTVTGEEVTFEELGGTQPHSTQSGVCDLHSPSEGEALDEVRRWLSYVPSNNIDDPPRYPAPEESGEPGIINQLEVAAEHLATIIPPNSNHPYDMKDVVTNIVDPDSFFEMKADFAPNMLIGFARLSGWSVGIIANNPNHMAGVLDIDASVKGARFVRFCDAFNIPIVTLVDVPGFLPGTDQEKGGIIRHGAKLLYAFSEATVPRFTLITRKAYGGAYDVMNSKHVGADLNLAWPDAEVAVMGAEGACNIIFRKEIAGSDDPEATRQNLVDDYSDKFATPYEAASRGYIDAVIYPAESRQYLIGGLRASMSKRSNHPKRKHDNIPL